MKLDSGPRRNDTVNLAGPVPNRDVIPAKAGIHLAKYDAVEGHAR
jgi:hypothetical protein